MTMTALNSVPVQRPLGFFCTSKASESSETYFEIQKAVHLPKVNDIQHLYYQANHMQIVAL